MTKYAESVSAVRLSAIALAALVLTGCATSRRIQDGGTLSAETVCEFSRDERPEGFSGISRIEGNRYFCVDDRGGLLHEVEIVLDENGDDGACRVIRSIPLEGRRDLEGCAVDPLDGRVWVSDEWDTSIRQFDPRTGRQTGQVSVPAVYRENVVGNRSLEGLAISPDGLRMYVANEDTLKCDGSLSGPGRGGLVRIQEFVRKGGGEPWSPSRQFLYATEKVEGSAYSGVAISGVSALCALGDGTLLVLEREMSQKNPLFPTFMARLFSVSLDAASGERLPKRAVWCENTMFSNYEGICFGPDLKNGARSLVLVSDGGGEAEERIQVLSLRSATEM